MSPGKRLPADPEQPRYTTTGRKARVCRHCFHILTYNTKIPKYGTNIPPMDCPVCGRLMEVTIIYNHYKNKRPDRNIT